MRDGARGPIARKVNLLIGRGVGPLRPAVLTAAVGLALATVGIGSATVQDTVAVRGTVINGTAGAELPPEVPVLLLVSDAANGLVFTGQALTELGGGFQFDDVPRTEEGNYALSVDYGGVFYDDTLSFQDVLDEVRLTVYETTEDASVVRVTRQILVITGVDKKDREISAIEFVRLNNSSDRTLLPDLTKPGQISFLRCCSATPGRRAQRPLQLAGRQRRLHRHRLRPYLRGFTRRSQLGVLFPLPLLGGQRCLPAKPAPRGGRLSSLGATAAGPG